MIELTQQELEAISDIPKDGLIILPKVIKSLQENKKFYDYLKLLIGADIDYVLEQFETDLTTLGYYQQVMDFGLAALRWFDKAKTIMGDEKFTSSTKEEQMKTLAAGAGTIYESLRKISERYIETPVFSDVQIGYDENGALTAHDFFGNEVSFESLDPVIKEQIMNAIKGNKMGVIEIDLSK